MNKCRFKDIKKIEILLTCFHLNISISIEIKIFNEVLQLKLPWEKNQQNSAQ